MANDLSKSVLLASAFTFVIMNCPMASPKQKDGVSVGGGVSPQPSPLVIHLRSAKSEYHLDELLELEVTIQNISDNDIYVLSFLEWGESASFSLWLKDPLTGKNVGGKVPSSPPIGPPKSIMSFTRLYPDYIFGKSSKFKFKNLHIDKPGTYVIEVTYHSPCPSGFSFGLPIWSKEMGPIKTNTVEIHVK